MNNCIFCQIVKGKLPCYKVYEDPNYLGFLDIKPLNPGNSLLIPKKHYHWVTDVPNIGEYFSIAKNIALKTQKVVKSDYITFLTLGTEVPHSHIRIIPRFFGDQHRDGINVSKIVKIDNNEMLDLSSKILNINI